MSTVYGSLHSKPNTTTRLAHPYSDYEYFMRNASAFISLCPEDIHARGVRFYVKFGGIGNHYLASFISVAHLPIF